MLFGYQVGSMPVAYAILTNQYACFMIPYSCAPIRVSMLAEMEGKKVLNE